jgi:cation diffusion facilitator CzcD-associated flavoprotein CzcO
VDVVVIGGGHCGLVMSQALSQRAVDHAVFSGSLHTTPAAT